MHSRFAQDKKTCFQALQKQLITAWCHYNHTYASLPFRQVCKCSTLMHSRFAQNIKHAFRLTAALQKELTTAWCHYSSTYTSLPFRHVCNCPTLMHTRFAQNTKHALWLCAALQNQLTKAWCHHSHTYKNFLSYMSAIAQHRCTAGLPRTNKHAFRLCKKS